MVYFCYKSRISLLSILFSGMVVMNDSKLTKDIID